MNFSFVFNRFGLLLLVLSALLAAAGAWSLGLVTVGDAAEQPAAGALLISAVIGGAIGFVLWWVTRRAAQIGRREALLLVALSWLLGAALSALPFFFWAQFEPGYLVNPHPFANYVDCYFEAMSGLTTTGATVLPNIAEADHASGVAPLPRSLLLWRSATHWLGGLGIVVLFVAVLPSLGVGGKRLFKVEAPGPKSEAVTPQIRETARALWLIYLVLTAAEIVALKLAGLDWFDSVCHTFATLATGGFSSHNSSIAGFDNAAVEWIAVVFMLLAGVNFGLYYMVLRGKWKQALRDTELRVYLVIMAVAATVITLSLIGTQYHTTAGDAVNGGAGDAVRYGVFQTVSIQTTTGFGTADFNAWPFVAQATLLALMFIGGCGGSTGGGLKVMRIWVMLKVIAAEVERAFRPNVVRPVKVGRATVDNDMKLGTVVFIVSMLLIVLAGGVAIEGFEQLAGHDECTFRTSGTAAVATLFNIGPGLGLVGATENYGWFTDASKLLMSLLMAIGRLELFAIIVLFSPRYWRGD